MFCINRWDEKMMCINWVQFSQLLIKHKYKLSATHNVNLSLSKCGSFNKVDQSALNRICCSVAIVTAAETLRRSEVLGS